MSEKGINRRQFLHTSGLVVASAAVASGGGPLLFRPSIAWAMSFHTLDEHTAKTLLKMSRHLYPSQSIEDDQYARTIEGFDAKAKTDRAFAKLLQDGVASLDRAAQGKWLDANDEVSLQTLKGMEATPFFQTVRGTLIGADGPYNLPEVWKKFGYEGSSWQFGGYLSRGFGDITWLPKD
ncbi:MAG: twin-arginine translocation signal domain-containing protein [Candidatus Binatia bacterium]|jgi:hypothetical protein